MNNEIFGWFPSESQTTMDKLIKDHDIKTVIEIGCFLGKSTAFIAKRVDKVLAIDPFVKWEDIDRPNGDVEKYGGDDFFDKFWENMEAEGVDTKITTIRSKSFDARFDAKGEFPKGADLVYVDGLHDYQSVTVDLAMYYPMANKIICGDDYDENWPGVKEAVDSFFDGKAKVHVEGRIWWVEL